jgi:hypothetical protein
MIDHDRLFKELIATFFLDFLELFFPQITAYLEPDSLTFLEKEIFTDVTEGKQYEADSHTTILIFMPSSLTSTSPSLPSRYCCHI